MASRGFSGARHTHHRHAQRCTEGDLPGRRMTRLRAIGHRRVGIYAPRFIGPGCIHDRVGACRAASFSAEVKTWIL